MLVQLHLTISFSRRRNDPKAKENYCAIDGHVALCACARVASSTRTRTRARGKRQFARLLSSVPSSLAFAVQDPVSERS